MRPRLAPLLVGLLVVACAAPTVAPTSSPSTTEAAPSTTEAAPSTVPPEAALEDGEHFAFVREAAAATLTVDPAEMLSGEEARAAAVEDGQIAEGEDLPNDFYIRNPDREPVVLPLASDAEVTLITFGPEGQLVEGSFRVEDLADVLSGALHETVYGVVPGELPALVTVQEGQVVRVEQQYLP